MMSKLSSRLVGVKFCGNCNPRLDTVGLLKELQSRAVRTVFVSWTVPGIDALLILSGCPADCASRPEFAGEVTVVAGNSLNGWEIYRDRLVQNILQCLEGPVDAELER